MEGDLGDPASLDRAAAGADVIVSAVSGGREVIVDGQVALAEAGARRGARHSLPSDFGLDYAAARRGEHPLFDLRAEARERVAALGIARVHLLLGAFMDLFVPGAFVVGADGVVGYWGEGPERLDVTSLEDTARMAARVALDDEVGGAFAFAGDRVSIPAADAVERRRGRPLERRRLGDAAELRAAWEAARRDPDPLPAAVLAFHVILLAGDAALSGLQNGRYPDLRLETFAEFADRRVGPA